MEQNTNETGSFPEKISAVQKIESDLRGEGAVNFDWIHEKLQDKILSDDKKAELLDLTVTKIEQALSWGNFRDLKGAKELLSFFGIESLSLSDEWTRLLEKFYLPRQTGPEPFGVFV